MTPWTPLRAAREWRRLTLRDVRAATGIGLGRLSMIERDMVAPNASEIERLSAALQATAQQMFPRDLRAELLCA